MKRFGLLLAFGFVLTLMTGCEGGLKEGSPTGELPKSGMTEGHREYMKKNAEKMKMQRPKGTPGTPKS